MRSPRIDLVATENIHMCPASENHRRCENKPRWSEESWSPEQIENLMRARADLEYRYDSCDREHRIRRSKVLMHGHVCPVHSDHVRRLHALNMIRGDARSDLRGPQHRTSRTSRARTARNRLTKQRANRSVRVAAHQQTRNGDGELLQQFRERSPSPANSDMTPLPQTPTTRTQLTELMLHAHLRESQDRERHLEHDLYFSNVKNAELGQSISQFESEKADLGYQNFQLRLANVRQEQEYIQMQNLLRQTAVDSARSSRNIAQFMAAKGL